MAISQFLQRALDAIKFKFSPILNAKRPADFLNDNQKARAKACGFNAAKAGLTKEYVDDYIKQLNEKR